jgi:hypothetical protein
MAKDAATRFRELVAGGAEIPYDVREPGEGNALAQYAPQTAEFVREHASELRRLDSFGSACAAIESAGLAAPYLEAAEVPVPPDGGRRGELAAVVFLCRLWVDSADFSLGRDRMEAALAELELGGDAADGEIEVVVPLRGLQMEADRLDLATATILRADTVEVPAEARLPEGTGVAGWQPSFLAVARLGAVSAEPAEDGRRPDAGARGVEAFRQLITALRLHKAGSVGLGPHAWARTRGDRWRRIGTGAGRPRPGTYVLEEEELNDLVALSRALADRSTPWGRRGPAPALNRAIFRFEAALERQGALESLNDLLLSLRFVLEGGGPANLGLGMRVAALCVEPEARNETRAIVNRAAALERELWSGEPAPADPGAPTPAETVAEIEELTRSILKDAACGHLGGDLRATADEILLADGLASGEGAAEQRGETAEWDVAEADDELTGEEPVELEESDVEPYEPEEIPDSAQGFTEGGRITVFSTREPSEPEEEDVTVRTPVSPTRERRLLAVGRRPGNATQLDERRPPERQAISDRVAFLFPRPETTEWNHRELDYDRRPERRVS